MTAAKMNTETMSQFLAQISQKYCQELSLWFLDGASSHKSKKFMVPANVSLVLLLLYSHELNPSAQLWSMLRRDYFANRVFDPLDAAGID